MAVPTFSETRLSTSRPSRDAAPLDRWPDLFGAPADARRRLASLRVLVVGVGSVGAVVALHLARLGVQLVGLVDPKDFGPGLSTQPIEPDEIGQSKAAAIATRVRRIAPATRVRWFRGLVQELPLADLDGFDVIAAATDNLTAELEVGNRAHLLGIPLLIGSVHGPTLTAQVRVLRNVADGPCLACSFGPGEWEQLATREAIFSCAGDVPEGAVAGPPTVSISPLCSVAADLLVLRLIGLQLGIGEEPADETLEYCAYGHRTCAAPLRVSGDCRGEHRTLRRAVVTRPLADCSLEDCAEAAGAGAEPGEGTAPSFTVDGHVFCEQLVCPGCGATRRLGELFPVGETRSRRCRGCGRERGLIAHPFHCLDPAPTAALGAVTGRPLRAVGGGAARAVVVRCGDDWTLVRDGAATRRGGRTT